MSMTIKEAHSWASSFLEKYNIINFTNEVEIMLMAIYDWNRNSLFVNWVKQISTQELEQLQSWLNRRVTGEPVQYIIGNQEFYGREFLVNPSVLIPRPETEILVMELIQEANQFFSEAAHLIVADIGTGSGAIGLTLALEKLNWQVNLIDISKAALATASYNCERLSAKASFFEGDLLTPLIELGIKLDIIVSNPPYIPTKEVKELMIDVKDHEPILALDGGEDGLDLYRRIVKQSKTALKSRGMLCFEIGINQSAAVVEILRRANACQVKVVKDLSGIERVIIAFFDY